MKTTSWYKCHKEGWRQDLVPRAYSHPAKINRGLARKIYAYAIEQGWLKEGDTCLDPFAGICGFALDAMFHGLHWIGCELEGKFVQLGQQNIDLWNRRYGNGKLRRWGTATILQGDSRNLIEVLEGARAEGIIASPPYSALQTKTGKVDESAWSDGRPRSVGASQKESLGYGTDPANLGNMPTGKPPPQCILSSPPYADSLDSKGHGIDESKYKHTKSGKGEHRQTNVAQSYGRSDGQLAAMREGDAPQAILSSPPFADSQQSTDADFELESTEVNPTPRKLADRSYFPAEMETDGQLAALPEGEPPQAVTMRCPYCGSPLVDEDTTSDNEALRCADCDSRVEYVDAWECAKEGEPPQVDGLIASPPYGDITNIGERHDPNKSIEAEKRYRANHPELEGIRPKSLEPYGDSPGQLGAMEMGEPPAGIVQVDACVSSPPWEESTTSKDREFLQRKFPTGNQALDAANGYGNHPDQLGNQQGDTFWAASRTIMEQCHQVLAPGGVAIFVTKRFVRNKQIVDFSQQWVDLCQSCGFELVEWIKAWLVEERGMQYDLEGEAHTKTVKRFSFFRRLHAQKYPHLAIDWEDVLIFRKPI